MLLFYNMLSAQHNTKTTTKMTFDQRIKRVIGLMVRFSDVRIIEPIGNYATLVQLNIKHKAERKMRGKFVHFLYFKKNRWKMEQI